MVEYLDSGEGRRLAYVRSAGAGPGVMFLGGFVSDMTGTKAVALEAWAKAQGRAFVRFDYSGHGASSGRFEEGCIGDWLEDARAVLEASGGPQVLVGSSMGGWIALLLAREMPEKVAGLVTIAAAPDFTDELLATLSGTERAALDRDGVVGRPSDYSPEGYVFTRRLFEDGARHRVFGRALSLPIPVRMFQGTGDAEVAPETATRLLGHADGADIRLTLVKGADHRFSTPDCLRLVGEAVDEVTARAPR
ncbi:MAG: alpha/beta hydrolase [Paracoccaceae bacterium]